MQRTAVFLALILATSAAWAEWVKVEDVVSLDYYYDPQTVRKDGSLRRVWEVQNLKNKRKATALSRRARIEYDCEHQKFSALSVFTYSGLMGSGERLSGSDSALAWHDIEPGSLAVLKLVCPEH